MYINNYIYIYLNIIFKYLEFKYLGLLMLL